MGRGNGKTPVSGTPKAGTKTPERPSPHTYGAAQGMGGVPEREIHDHQPTSYTTSRRDTPEVLRQHATADELAERRDRAITAVDGDPGRRPRNNTAKQVYAEQLLDKMDAVALDAAQRGVRAALSASGGGGRKPSVEERVRAYLGWAFAIAASIAGAIWGVTWALSDKFSERPTTPVIEQMFEAHEEYPHQPSAAGIRDNHEAIVEQQFQLQQIRSDVEAIRDDVRDIKMDVREFTRGRR